MDDAPFEAERGALGQWLERVFRRPLGKRLRLGTVDGKVLAEVAPSVHERHRDERYAEVGRGANGVAGEHAEASGIGGYRALERKLHGEVRGEGRGHECELTRRGT